MKISGTLIWSYVKLDINVFGKGKNIKCCMDSFHSLYNVVLLRMVFLNTKHSNSLLKQAHKKVIQEIIWASIHGT